MSDTTSIDEHWLLRAERGECVDDVPLERRLPYERIKRAIRDLPSYPPRADWQNEVLRRVLG